jgi:hypothetical protein
MTAEFFPQSSTEAPEKIAVDLVGAVGKLTEAAREARLQSTSKPCEDGTQRSFAYQWPQTYSPFSPNHARSSENYNEGVSNSSTTAVEDELQSQLDALHGTSIRHRQAAAEDLDDVVSKVNGGQLVDGLKLGAIDSSSKLHIQNTKGGADHSDLTIDLDSGVISDQSSTRYVAKEERGRIGFTPVEPVTVKSSDSISATFDAKDQPTKIVLQDGTTLSKDVTPVSRYAPPTFTISNASGKEVGTAQNVIYDGKNLVYKTDNGQSLVAIGGNRMVVENLVTGEMRSKVASEPGIPLPSRDPVQQLMDAEQITRGALSMGIPVIQPRLNSLERSRSDLLPI